MQRHCTALRTLRKKSTPSCENSSSSRRMLASSCFSASRLCVHDVLTVKWTLGRVVRQ